MKKYTISLPEDISKDMDVIASSAGISKADVFRNAIGIYRYLFKEVKKKHNRLIIKSENENEKEIVFQGML